MEFYSTKGDLLFSQGKDRADTRWVDRQVAKGLISHCDEGYYFVMDYLKYENEMLKEKLKEKSDLKDISRAMGEKVLSHGEINNLKMDNSELRDHLKFFYEMDLARKEAMNNVVQAYYDKNPNDGWENAVEKANAFMKFSESPFEADEIEYVKGIIN